MRPRVKSGTSVPQSIAAAGAIAVESTAIVDAVQANTISQGERPITFTETNGAPTRKERRKKAKEVDAEKAASRAKPKTDELPGMPAPDGVGLAAQKFQTSLEKLESAQLEKGDCMTALYKALVKAKRTSITVNGYTFERHHQGPRDTIKVKKPK